MLKDYNLLLKIEHSPIRPRMRKKGTLAIGTVETTPVVWQDRLLRFEWVRNSAWGGAGGITREKGCYRFVDMETRVPTPEFADDHSFGCCYAENGVMYVHGTRGPGGGNTLDVFWSSDLVHWETKTALTFPEDINLFNTSVCKSPDGYIMAIEIGGSNPIVGVPFTCIFACSDDLLNWTLLPTDSHVYARDRYTACPSIRWFDGWYYMVYLESAPCHRWIPYIVRSRDLSEFELGLTNPFMWFSDEDKQIVHPEDFTPEEVEQIQNAIDCNNSDVDFCEYKGRTVILYSWGNQYGKEHLAEAEYPGGLQEFLESYF